MPEKIKNLVIVESPAKARTIGQYLGKDYKVLSSFGHIRDLPKKGLNIDIEHDFKPTYAVSPDKLKVVKELKQASKNSSDVWLASDEDREGEAIAWHLTQALGLNPKTTKRIVFHEITKPAIEYAIKHPRAVNLQLVDAYQARRVLDRLVGYELSPVLWKKVRAGLSAGRVQSVGVRLVVDREREIREFEAKGYYKVIAIFDVKGQDLKAELLEKLATKDKAKKFIEAAKTAKFKVASISQKPGLRNPSPPFTTSTLQQEAARRLGYGVRQTMTLAQRLYESGYITYMRTDSTLMSGLALKAAGDYILKNFGEAYHKQRQYQTKDASAQEAHEAIRPTDFKRGSAGQDAQQTKLYQLIWRRALASQMSEARTERTEISIDLSNRPEKLLAKGEVVQFAGFMKVYDNPKDDTLLPAVEEGQSLDLDNMTATESFSRPPARYSEATLVRKLEELGIGRPSTYATTISTIQTRGYVEKRDLEGETRTIQVIQLKSGKITDSSTSEVTGADRGKLLPTSAAEVTTDFLVKYFPDIVNFNFTAEVESDFDKIADGKEQWVKMINTFYKSFHPLVGKSEKASREEVSQARELGNDPTSGKPILARFGRYGPMLQRGETESEEKPDFAPLPADVSLEEVTLAQALEMFKLPRLIGKTEKDEEIYANIGRFGPYIKVNKTFVSIKDHDPFKITLDEARTLYAEKLDKDLHKYIAEFPGGIKVVNGPYGPYVTDGKKNAKIPAEVEPAKLTKADAQKLIAEAPAKRAGGRRFGKKKQTNTQL
ncbi:MAG TPA: type I DNA topoisomerase [Candidatus Binatia bacterium]|nr:type I DNA topoisomerase [Candidatus Binatia bacterium]